MKRTTKKIREFANCLSYEEKSQATQEKYLREAQAFCVHIGDQEITKERVISWKGNW